MSYSSEVLADSPLVYWKLDETSGTSAADSTGNGRNATYTNSPGVGAASLLTDGSGHSMSTTVDSNGCVSIPSASWMNLTTFTVSVLTKLTTTVADANGDAIVSRLVGGSLDWVLLRDSSSKWFASVWNTAGTRFNATSVASVVNNTRYHLAFTWDGSNLILYVDGTAVATTPTTGTPRIDPCAIEIGRYSASGVTTPPGSIDEVAIYGTALSSTRIAAHYAAATGAGSAASGTASLSLSASGAAAATLTGTAALSLSASGAAKAAVVGTASLSLSASGDVTPPVAASGTASLSLSASGNAGAGVAGTASLDLSATGAATGAQAASGTASLSLSASGSATLGAVGTALLTLLASGEAQALYTTDTTNARHGRRRLGRATVTITRPVAALPPTLVLSPKVDKAAAYPVPTMVEGRPT